MRAIRDASLALLAVSVFACSDEQALESPDGSVLDASPSRDTGGDRGSTVDSARPDARVLDASPDVATPDAGPSCTLTPSGPVTVSSDGEIVEGLRIEASGEPAIRVDGHANVTIRNVEILHEGARGIFFSNADDITIENVSIEHTGSPATGENPSSELNNIECFSSARPRIHGVRLSRGSSGIYLLECPNSMLTSVEGYDFRGPFPRGQLVQWNSSDGGVLEDFSVVNPAGSWPEDNVNVYRSLDVVIRRGHIDGNNSPSGVGVIFDGDTSVGLVEDVDAIRMGNGCFSAYAGAEGSIFRRTRCRENICVDQGRGAPLSNALMWSGNTSLSTLRIESSAYFASCNGNVVWPSSAFELAELEEQDFPMRPSIEHTFCWERPGG